MKQLHIQRLCLTALLLLSSLFVRGQTITGQNPACILSTYTYTYTATGSHPGVTYYWSLSPAIGTITATASYATSATATIAWNNAGNTTLTMHGDSAGITVVTATENINITAIPHPYITTNSRVACQSSDTLPGNPPPPLILSDTYCVKACNRTVVKYFANGGLKGDTYVWSITGGTMTAHDSASVTVLWNDTGMAGTVTLYDDAAAGCTYTITGCIQLIARPHASFAVDTASIARPAYTVCTGAKTLFKNLSWADSGASIGSYHWDFGDRSYADEKDPSHTYSSPGTYNAVLRVSNSCGCADTIATMITVQSNPGPRIECPGVVCQGDTATYYTPDSCGGAKYYWKWSAGATLVSAAADSLYPRITLRWDSAGTDGYGTLSLSNTTCLRCSYATTVKIPVVQTYARITGPSKVCTGKPYSYSLPLWPGARYDWGVIGDPGAVISARNGNTVSVQFSSPGTYTLHGWYQNGLKLCGGDVKYRVTATNPATITSITPTSLYACSGATVADSLSDTLTGFWTLTGSMGRPLDTATGHVFNTYFTTPGTYMLTVSPARPGAFCAPDPIVYTVVNTPYEPDSISGVRLACKNTPYAYNVVPWGPMPGMTYQWQITGGGTDPYAVSGNGFGDSITLYLTNDSMTVQVRGIALDTPNCTTNWYTFKVFEKNYNPILIDLSSDVCPNSTQLVQVWYGPNILHPTGPMPDSDLDMDFKWSIYDVPPSISFPASIIAGQGSNSATVRFVANNTHATAYRGNIQCIVTQCGISKTVSTGFLVYPGPQISLSALHGSICNGQADTLVADSGSAQYVWSYGDGTTDTTASDTTVHRYHVTSSGLLSLPISVYGLGSAGLPSKCPDEGIGYASLFVNGGPFASIYTRDGITYCGSASVSDTLIAGYTGATGDADSFQYTWYDRGTVVKSGKGALYDTLTVHDTGMYYLVFKDQSGCGAYHTDSVVITNTGACTPCPHALSIALSNTCNGVVNVTGTGTGLDPAWGAPGGTIANPVSAATSITYPQAGYYKVTFSENFDTCIATTTVNDSTALAVNWYWSLDCPFGSYYNDYFRDKSTALPDWSVTHYGWSAQPLPVGTATSGSGATWNPSLAPGTYIVTDTVTAQLSPGTTQTCTLSDTVVIPAVPTISIVQSTSSTCEGVPISYSASETPAGAAALTDYYWYFGIDGSSALPAPEWAYTYYTPSSSAAYDTELVYLSVTDFVGCSYTATTVDSIYHNTRADGYGGTTAIACPGTVNTYYVVPGFLSDPIVSYLWIDGTTSDTDYITRSGIYYCTVTDVHGCWDKASPIGGVAVMPTPDLTIRGRISYCQGETVYLSYFNDSSLFTYQWLRNGTPITGGDNLYDSGLAPGTYVYRLIASIDPAWGCPPDTSGNDTVIIHANPSAPVISSVTSTTCSPYTIKMQVTAVTGDTYNWSDGAYGTTDYVNAGGAYRVWCTDTFGCQNHADELLPYPPESYMAWFPAGCYMLCNQSSPDSLYGPPASFNAWSYVKGSSVTSSGSGTITPLGITSTSGTGTYELALYNGYCRDTSDTMSVAFEDCSAGCPSIISGNPVLTCDVPTNSAGYVMNLTLTNPYSGTDTITVVIGLDIGPAEPFVIKLPPGMHMYTLHFTTLHSASSANLKLQYYTSHVAHPCYASRGPMAAPACSWTPEVKHNPIAQPADTVLQTATAMLVYPNPASSLVNVQYNYGYKSDAARYIVLYDVTGRTIARQQATDVMGMVTFPLGQYPSGTYIVRMEDGGRAVETGKLSVTH